MWQDIMKKFFFWEWEQNPKMMNSKTGGKSKQIQQSAVHNWRSSVWLWKQCCKKGWECQDPFIVQEFEKRSPPQYNPWRKENPYFPRLGNRKQPTYNECLRFDLCYLLTVKCLHTYPIFSALIPQPHSVTCPTAKFPNHVYICLLYFTVIRK